MKKITILFFSILLMLSLNTNIYASESMDSNEYSIIKTFSDGSYIKSVLIDDSTDCSSLARKTSTKTGRRVYSYESSSGKLLWTITITGTFSYTGSSSKCTKSEISTTCPASNWKLSEKKAYTSGSSAKATASFKQYKKDVYLQTITRTVTLSCNKSGKLY